LMYMMIQDISPFPLRARKRKIGEDIPTSRAVGSLPGHLLG
jgi:hypothetical protein